MSHAHVVRAARQIDPHDPIPGLQRLQGIVELALGRLVDEDLAAICDGRARVPFDREAKSERRGPCPFERLCEEDRSGCACHGTPPLRVARPPVPERVAQEAWEMVCDQVGGAR